MPNLTGLTTSITPRGVQRNLRFYLWNGRDRMRVNDGENWRNGGILPWRSNIITIAKATNTVTVTTASAHGLSTGMTVETVVDANATSYNTTVAITVTTSTAYTYTYTNGTATITSATNAGFATLAPTVAAGASTGLSGTYYYYIAPVNAAYPTYQGRVKQGLPSARSLPIAVNNQDITVSGIPSTHPDAQVTHWALYRNKNGYLDLNVEDEAQDFFLVDMIAIGTTSYTDSTPDDALASSLATVIEFNANYPPTFKSGAVFAERLFGCGFDALTTGTATVNTNTCLIDFSSVTIPDGVVGCYFQKQGDDARYTIVERPTTSQVVLDAPFSGTLSAASYQIYNDPSELYFSEWNDFDAWGADGEAFRNKLRVGGSGSVLKLTCCATVNGALYAFSQDKIYKVYLAGSSTDSTAIRITPDPFYDGIGCVGPDAFCQTDNEMYFLSLRGPAVFDGSGAPRLIGEKLGTDWISGLNASQLQIAAVGYCPASNCVLFALPQGSDTENSLVYAFDRYTGTWWKHEHVHPSFFYTDVDSSNKPALFYSQGQFIFQWWTGTNDGVPSGTKTGSPTSSTTTSITDSGASFYTTGSGLAERYIHIYDSSNNLRARRRITSNTGTVINWSSSGTSTLGQGAVSSIAATDTYYIGPVLWNWRMATKYGGTKEMRDMYLHMNFDLQGESTASTVYVTDYTNDTARSQTQGVPADLVHKKMTLNSRGFESSPKIEVRASGNQIAIRDLTIEAAGEDPKRKDK